MKVSRGACGDFQRSTARKRSFGVEWDLDGAAKEGGKPAADEIELEGGQKGKYDNDISSKLPRRGRPSGTYGQSKRPFGHGRGLGRGCGRCGSNSELSVPLSRVRVQLTLTVMKPPVNPETQARSSEVDRVVSPFPHQFVLYDRYNTFVSVPYCIIRGRSPE